MGRAILSPEKNDNKVQRRALLLHSARPDVQDIFDVLSDTGSAKDNQKAEDALTRHFVTQVNMSDIGSGKWYWLKMRQSINL